jgi:hypothetical protein
MIGRVPRDVQSVRSSSMGEGRAELVARRPRLAYIAAISQAGMKP